MDEQLKQKLVTYMDSMEEAIKTGSDFVAEQAPMVVQEYLNWCFWEAVAWASIGTFIVAFIAVAYFVLLRVSAKWRDEFDKGVTRWSAGAVGGLISAAVLVEAVVPKVLVALQITIAPRVFLLERIAELVK